jgi:hypothetical protein
MLPEIPLLLVLRFCIAVKLHKALVLPLRLLIETSRVVMVVLLEKSYKLVARELLRRTLGRLRID